jgi:ferredoxin-NADP reductase
MLCGPKEMMESMAEQLAELGIKRSHIIYEDFAFK